MRCPALLLVLGLALHAGAQQTALDAALDNLAAQPPGAAESYLEARAAVLELGPAAQAGLQAVAGDATNSWQRRIVAAACALHLSDPELAAAVAAPRGLDPDTYARFRRPQPLCEPDLVRCGAAAVPLFIERFHWTLDAYSFSPGEAGVREREVYQRGLLAAVGRLGDAGAARFLRGVLQGLDQPLPCRRQAALGLAQTAAEGALAELLAWVDDTQQDRLLREACARGLGHIPSLNAAQAIAERLQLAEPSVRRGLLSALGSLGSSWGWQARLRNEPDLLSSADLVRESCSLSLLQALADYPEEAETIGSGLAMTAWPASLAGLEALLEGTPEQSRAAAQVLPLLQSALARQ